MSCCLVGMESLYQLADYLQTLKVCGFDYFGYSMNAKLREAIPVTETEAIYYQLAELNLKAYNDRYDITEDCVTFDAVKKANIKSLYHPKEWDCDNHCDVIKPWHYQLLKKLQCFTYQCSEDINRGSKLLEGLNELETEMACYMVANQPEYVKAQWC